MLLLLRRAPGTAPRVGPVGVASTPNPVVISSTGRPNGAQTADGGIGAVWTGPYPDVNAGYTYPPPVTAPQGRPNNVTNRASAVPATQTDFSLKVLSSGPGPRWNGLLLGLPVATVSYRAPGQTEYVQVRNAVILPGAGGGFPTQYAGLRVQANGRIVELSVVAIGDAPSGMGGVWRVQVGAGTRAVYLVETTDPLASPVRVKTGTGTKSARLKT